MNYKLIYDKLITKGKQRTELQGYTEKHHIIPKCMGGTDLKDNLVALTSEEHYVAHQLLIKIYPNNSLLVFAAHKMCCGRFNNKLYGWLKRKHAIEIGRVNSIKNRGKNNPCFNMRWIHNCTLKQSKRIHKSDALPMEWEEGRVVNFESHLLRKLKAFEKKEQQKTRKNLNAYLKHKNKTFKEQEKQKKLFERQAQARKLYDLFINSKSRSVRDFLKTQNQYQYSLVSLCKLWKKFIPEYKPTPRKCFRG